MDFSAEEISSDGTVILPEKLERKHGLLSHFSQVIPDKRHPFRTVHRVEKLLKQRVYSLMQGYEDANDTQYLKKRPVIQRYP